jgi:hypothetical protein
MDALTAEIIKFLGRHHIIAHRTVPAFPQLFRIFFLSSSAFAGSHTGKMSPSEPRTIFYGPVVNPVSHSSFQALPRCLLAVGPSGEIDWIVEDVHKSALLDVLAQHGSPNTPLIVLRRGEFLLPGFVDTHTVCALLTQACGCLLCSPMTVGHQ